MRFVSLSGCSPVFRTCNPWSPEPEKMSGGFSLGFRHGSDDFGTPCFRGKLSTHVQLGGFVMFC